MDNYKSKNCKKVSILELKLIQKSIYVVCSKYKKFRSFVKEHGIYISKEDDGKVLVEVGAEGKDIDKLPKGVSDAIKFLLELTPFFKYNIIKVDKVILYDLSITSSLLNTGTDKRKVMHDGKIREVSELEVSFYIGEESLSMERALGPLGNYFPTVNNHKKRGWESESVPMRELGDFIEDSLIWDIGKGINLAAHVYMSESKDDVGSRLIYDVFNSDYSFYSYDYAMNVVLEKTSEDLLEVLQEQFTSPVKELYIFYREGIFTSEGIIRRHDDGEISLTIY